MILKINLSPIFFVIVLLAVQTSTNATPQSEQLLSNPFPLSSVFYASQSGRATLDQDTEGGNPFASALIELLNRPSL